PCTPSHSLPSSPPRRSSDLDAQPRATPDPNATKGSHAVGQYTPLWGFLDQWSNSQEKALVDMTVTDRHGEPFAVSWHQLSSIVKDRKSTRLNSTHVSNSYAD